MRYYESKNGYKYKEYKNGKKIRISDKDYYKNVNKIGGSKSPINIAKEKTKKYEDVFEYLKKYKINYDHSNVVESINKELINGNKDFKKILIHILKLEDPIFMNE